MLIPLSWLKEYVDITLPTPDLAERLTLAGLEVAGVEQVGDWWDPETILVGEVVAVHPHPDADRLVLVDVDYGGEEPQRVVTGAPNLFQYRGQSRADGTLPVLKAPFARSGAVLIDAYSDERPRPKKKLKPSKIRGIRSAGMVCSELELGLSEEHEGILLLPEDAPTGQPLRYYLGQEVMELELTPDMARCLSIIGVAREVAALTGAPLHLPEDAVESAGDDAASDYVAVRIDDPELCNRYTGIMIRDVEIGPSPRWMQERLRLAGMRPINNIVDITNYVMLEWGQPLHAFDYDILMERAQRSGSATPTIIVRRAEDGSRFTTLDDVQRTMDSSMLMIADTAGDIAIAGVMGGQESEVGESTRNVLLESATFEGINNRRTASELRLPSEASYRFARGVPATLNPIAARRAAELMRQYAGGRVVSGMVDAYPVEQVAPVVYTTAGDMRRLLGMEVTLADITDALEQLDFTVRQVDSVAADAPADATFALFRASTEAGAEPLLECVPPWHRLDIRYPADLTEEVARIIGYEHVSTTLIADVLPPQRRDFVLETQDRIRDTLVAIGLQEVIANPLTTIENHVKLLAGSRSGASAAPVDYADAEGYVTLTNPISPDRQHMRRSTIVSAMENLAYNLRFSDRLATFELGRIYLADEGDGLLPQEERRLNITLAGPRRLPDFYTGGADGAEGGDEMDFFDLKGVVETLLDRLGFGAGAVEFVAQPDTATFGPRCAEVRLHGKRLGLMGEIHPRVSDAFDLPSGRICVADLLIEPLVKPEWSIEPMQPISNYPAVMEDLAFEVSEAVTARQMEDTMRSAGGDLLVRVELFDIYRGESIPAGQKSMAYRLTYQSTERSLSEREVTKLRKRIIRAVEQSTDGKLRG